MANSYTYTDAFEELQIIVAEIETGKVNVDELSERIKRASQLIAVCKTKLTATEAEVDKLLAELTEELPQSDSEPPEEG
ncbi:exodeoxyribonuclease VII small subunit [Sphingobacterium alkalisoli]|uniref:Exodeoxyribonuclease VII small subunit n=1 Tax=Sphingobacterium alkalisoli TaxID=1874115 RepID=A0A4U0H836_9SPHI|nr:exodeoxyribonuclease VII small subunit [Sphingobacterium alkalisoli]TJY67990.1 exodeoxyribonuclease VII small subunit [Sphingobacterium alkalisoli]GGH09834.1 exodeoxyribonuclease 7 small subunit [Sphingobacterium alkalisoli]